MPLNLLKKYNQFLELNDFNYSQRKSSLLGVFNRDIANNPNFRFRLKRINPTPKDNAISMDTLFDHLTRGEDDHETKSREFEIDRSKRLHWIKYHVEEKKQHNMFVFSVEEPKGLRTYIYDKDEKYVIVLEPLRKVNEYYLLSAFYVKGKDDARDKYMKKYKRKLNEVL